MDWDRNTILRQGYVVENSSLSALGIPNLVIDDNLVVMIASHDCDLAQHPQNEPFVELLIGCLVSEANGNYTHAKSARRLHLQFENNQWVELEAVKKTSVCKFALQTAVLNSTMRLSVDDHTNLQLWLASRYRRSAFPDEFEKRLTNKNNKLSDKISKVIKPLGIKVVGVFFDVDEGMDITRDGDDDTYTLDITILHASEPDIFESAEAGAVSASKTITDYFTDKLFNNGQWKSIELRSCIAISDSVLTYSEFKTMKRWRLDYISLAADPQQAVPSE